MANDPTVQWSLANPFGISINEESDGWHSGHVNDVLDLANGSLLAGTQSGGVWLINTNGTTMPLSDSWAVPDINCLAQGPDDEHHVFAGCNNGIIRETDLGEAVPLLAWREITNPLPPGAGDVKRILIIRNLRTIIAACTKGMYWATIPPTNRKRGCLIPFGKPPARPLYNWQRARMDSASDNQGFWDATIASTKGSVNRSSLEDRSFITIVAGSHMSGGLFVGQWNTAGILVMSPSKIHNEDGTDATGLFTLMGSCSVDSAESSANFVYAACSWSTKTGLLFRVLRSIDGGQSWGICAGVLKNGDGDLSVAAGEQGRDWNNCIAVSPNLANLVAFGWGAVFISPDSGTTWTQAIDDRHLHADIHSLRFSPLGSVWAKDLYVGSDGGVARIDMDLALKNSTDCCQSNYNRFLPTLQCYSTLIRQFWGTITASNNIPHLVATGSQDNSNLCSTVSPGTQTPWINMEGGDGGWTGFVNGNVLLHNIMGETVTCTLFDATGTKAKDGSITINQPADNPTEMKGPVAEVVKKPEFRNELGQLLVALASPNNNQVFALFTDDEPGVAYHWGFIGSVPQGEAVSALASFNGSTIHIGAAGKMYAMDVKTGKTKNLPIDIHKTDPDSKLVPGSINRIVHFSEVDAFAIMNSSTETIEVFNPYTGNKPVVLTSSYILRLVENGSKWIATPGYGLPNEAMYGLESVQLPNSRFPRALFVTTDSNVYISREDSTTWQSASQNLPATPHCGDVRFVSFAGSPDAWLYLGTFGRSMWGAKLR
jgi:hypothetical protein